MTKHKRNPFEVIFDILALIAAKLDIVIGLLVDRDVVGFSISQFGGTMITGVKVGGSGTFVETPIPPGSVLPAGVVPVWTVDDALVSLSPSPDGTGVVASVGATDTATSFNLTVTATLADGTKVTGTANVPITPLPPPVPTGFAINQTA